MDFRFSAEEEAFRQEVRDFLARELRPGLRAADDTVLGVGVGEDEQDREWLHKLAARGWVAPAWPREYGGAGLSVMQQFIFNEEMALARAPGPNFLGIALAGPTIILHGNEAQKQEHLAGMLSGEILWCQGFSEPGSGSDLASLQTRAVRDGDDYVINGQKIWTSGAHQADRMMLLARTDPNAPKHKGISYFLLDMHSPGVAVQPLENMAGTRSFTQVFFEDVRVPARDLLGEENRGWYYAVTTLDFERSSINSAAALQSLLEEIADFLRAGGDGASALASNPSLRYEITDRAVETHVARVLSFRVASMQARGLIPNVEASITKLYGAEMAQRIARTGIRTVGLYGGLRSGSRWAPLAGRLEQLYLLSVGATLAGGTSEIQRNVIAQRGLGLPRD